MTVNTHVVKSTAKKAIYAAENEATAGKPYCNSRGDVTGSDFDLM